MFPHNSSSHEISTETNAFVQNSKGDVVVLEGSSLSGVGEGNGPEHARYCDIEFINSSMMAAPTSHPEATAANDFLTVLSHHSGELRSAGVCEAHQSVAPATVKNTTNHLLTYDNNKVKNNNHNNAEHNHHKCRKQNTTAAAAAAAAATEKTATRKTTPGMFGQLSSSADTSKSTSKPLSDNKDSFSDINVRVLKISNLYLKVTGGDACRQAGVPSLVRIPKSDRPQQLPHLATSVDNYSSSGSRLRQGDNNNVKAKLSLIINKIKSSYNSKSVILLSSSSYGDYYLLLDGNRVASLSLLVDDDKETNTFEDRTKRCKKPVAGFYDENDDEDEKQRFVVGNIIISDNEGNRAISPISSALEMELFPAYAHYVNAAKNVSSSITLIVSKNELITDDTLLLSFLMRNFRERVVQERFIIRNSPLGHVTVTELVQRICVPLSIDSERRNCKERVAVVEAAAAADAEAAYRCASDAAKRADIRNNNPDVIIIGDNVNVAVCYKTSSITTTDVRTLGSQNDGISCTEATIFTVGALSFQDNDKSNKPLNASFKNKYQVSTALGYESNSTIKSVSKSTLSDKSSDKSDVARTTRLDESDRIDETIRSAVYIPTPTTCEPTMTLKCQSPTVASQTNAVPAFSPIENSLTTNHDDNARDKDYPATMMIINDVVDASLTLTNDQRLISDAASTWTNSIARARALILEYQEAYRNDAANCALERQRLKVALNTLFTDSLGPARTFCRDISDPIIDYKRRWGIPTILGLAGGGESSLNSSGTGNWGAAQATTPNNNNANAQGWGPPPGNQSANTGPPSNWAGNNVNRSVAANPNQNQNQGPPVGPNNPGNVNKVTNPNQPPNAQTGPPTPQSNNATQGNQNTGQWSQGKSNNPVGPVPNPPAPNTNNNNNTNVPPQQASPGTNANNNQIANPAQGTVSTVNSSPPANPSTKQQLEQLNTMREALFSQDGWGCQVNQDSNWDVPSSPEPIMTKDGVPMWKPPVNNGTDLWEANLRNGGQPPPQQQAKTPWGHTPSTNIGGTWGEDDEAADSSNMWTGTPTPSQPNTAQWPGASGSQSGSGGWSDHRIDPRDPRDIRSVDPREMRDPRDHRMSLDPRDHMRVMDPMVRDPMAPRMGEMRGDPRGISGRLNGASADAMWAQPAGPPHHQMSHQHPSGPPAKMINPSSMNQWAAPPPKEMMPPKPSGWEEPSPPPVRRNVQNYDDGTSLWGNPGANQRTISGNKVSHWKDLPAPNLGRGGMNCPPGMPQNRMPGQPSMKPDVAGPMWAHPSGPNTRNGSWADGPHETSGWDEPKTPGSWNEQQLNPTNWGGPAAHKPKPLGPSGSWTDSDMDSAPSWAHPNKPALTKEVIWNSREFRYLCDLGYKKEDVEVALRNREMNRDEAQELLSQVRPLDQWRRHEAHSGYDPSNQATSAQAYPRFNHVAQQMSFPPGAGMPSGASAGGGVSGSVANASLLKLQQQQQQQAAVQLQQQQPNTNAPQPPFNQASRTPQNQPSTQQLRMLVQQIQLAVQEGYLNHQILNQPLAPQTLILLNQLLQQIKVLQQLHQQHSVQSSLKGNSQTVLQISVQITKTKQQIANLQNQIAVQQATYMKQQQQQHPAPSQQSEYYKTPVHDPMSALQNTFSDLAMNKEPQVSQQQSRLNQWKLPSLDKDGDAVTNEFSRAPGTTSKPPTTPGSLTQSHTSPNMNPLLGQADGTWSSRLGESGWPDAGNSDSTDGKDWQPGGAAFTDLVPEFEPGKPWKMKSIEDDPSITPGSVVRSPLSLATIKDSDTIFSASSKTSPPPQPINTDTSIPSLSNSTWSFNPPATTPSAFTSSKNTWCDSAPPPTAVTSELWGAPMSKARGPPPGLGNKGGVVNASNGWAGLSSVGRTSTSWGLQSGGAASNSGWVSTWLLLKNLTPQIDGSTLKTLCMQHGPVQDFRLYLNHGIALIKYSSRDEAIKAQGALNNCVLVNTTIFAESPAEAEVHTMLQQLSHGGGGSQPPASGTGGTGWGLRPANKTGPPPDTWGGSSGQLWGAPPASNSLWSNTGLDSSDQQRATPSSLNSYLPGDLLGGESM